MIARGDLFMTFAIALTTRRISQIKRQRERNNKAHMGISTATRTGPSRVATREHTAPPDEATTYLAVVFRTMLAIGIGLIVAGSALGLIRNGSLPTPVIGISHLFSGLVNLDTAAILTLGVLVFMIAPATAIAFMVVSYARAHDRLYTLISAGVFTIIIGSIVVAWLSGASAAQGSKPAVSPLSALGVVIVAAVAGILGSMVGLGGGVFIVPILSIFFGIPLKTAIAASAVSVIVNSLGGSSVYLKHRMTNVRLGLFMELTTAAGAIIGGLIVVLVAPDVLRVIFGLALLAMGAAMFRRQHESEPVTDGPDALRLRQDFLDPAEGENIKYIPQRLGIGAAASSLAGVISGMLGIGGGAVKVPIMNTIMRVPVKAAAATSVFMVGITVSASAFIYYIHNIIDLSVTAPAVIGVLLGSQLGAHVSRHLRSVVLVRILVLILAYLAINLLLQAAGVRMPGASG
jgi:uncharacterized membrane protein YfcA/uncharacterized membrane protein